MTLKVSKSRSRLSAAVGLCIALTAGLVGAEWPQPDEVGAPPDSARLAQSELHEVSISVNVATGEFTYSLNPVRAKRGDRIEWNSEQGNWSVRFATTPFPEKSLRGKRGGPKHLVVKPDAAFGSYKYTVGLAVGDDVFVDDPEILIGPN